jgi:hypothetical protein
MFGFSECRKLSQECRNVSQVLRHNNTSDLIVKYAPVTSLTFYHVCQCSTGTTEKHIRVCLSDSAVYTVSQANTAPFAAAFSGASRPCLTVQVILVAVCRHHPNCPVHAAAAYADVPLTRHWLCVCDQNVGTSAYVRKRRTKTHKDWNFGSRYLLTGTKI